MYLKSIEVHGFKSFANKIIFEFHNGITGIVGPNGSGKSNVADAVRWVLGEQRAKQLRGANMQDVIFSGTENRKPLGYASVAITLDNSDHQLQIGYEEVTIARRVYRSGESEYLINGTGCRLKDVNELFYDTGIGKEGYSIIGQGQIDKILSGRPEERRELFDEAAGIVKFKRRKNTAQKKLEDEKQNLIRINDILKEIEKQLGPLEKQSETAKVYLKKKDELKILDVNMFLMEIEQIREQTIVTDEKYRIAHEDFLKTTADYGNSKLEFEKLEITIENMEHRLGETKEHSNLAGLQKQQLEGQINVLLEQINTARLNDEHLHNRMESIQKEISGKEIQKQQLAEEKESVGSELLCMADVQSQAEQAVSDVQKRIQVLNTVIEEGKNSIIGLLNQRASTKGKIQRYDTMLEQVQIRKAELSQKILKLKSDEAEQEEQLSIWKAELEAVSRKIGKYNGRHTDCEHQVAALQTDLDGRSEKLRTGQTSYHREQSRLESLKNITERYDGYGNSIRRVMEQKEHQKGILGVVADIIRVDKSYEIAVETALGGSIQNVVTDNEQTAKSMIGYLKQNKLGRATFLPLTSVGNRSAFRQEQIRNEPGFIGMASELVETDDQYRGLAGYLLGRTVVADHIDHAIVMARKYNYSLRIVTVEGESLSPGGSMTGGAFKNSSNLLGRRREIEELTARVQALYQEMEQQKAGIEEAKARRAEYYRRIEELKQKLQEQYLLQNTAGMNVNQAEEKKEANQRKYNSLKTEGAEIEIQLKEIRSSRDMIIAELSESQGLEKQADEGIQKHQHQLLEERQAETAFVKRAEEIHLSYANLAQKESYIQENIKRIQQEMARLNSEQREYSENLNQAAGEIERRETEIEGLGIQIKQAVQIHLELEEKAGKLSIEKEELTRANKAFFEKRESLSERMNALDKECFRLNSQKEKLEEVSESQMNYMWEEYELAYHSALALKSQEPHHLIQLKKCIVSLKEEIRKLGDVNVNAIEDYKGLLERFEFLSGQRNDLVEAEQTLLGIIAELDAGMRVQFKEKFELICQEFDKAFKELFGGGKGTLELLAEEDILEAGIRIISQPPGKKLQNMMQLSGGEKALTAIALLFAIQNLKPSPFCLLDEIEAALDDSNVGRFANYLHKLTKNTQFIIITHRRGTMAAADRLYGITMQEKGVSTLVSVNLIENDLDK